ncbi:ribosome-binding protein 1-like isoform X2 [Diorhabda sublineata]|uniref:ribosome-binding protein 1-like isoform X2 n=1 Tax=Diorhabda sublineata TaxID=1163346 RepID=UPI0024E14333|nr:ribosome-binding protein 1-like isoform X2 [Diorhabda sublineata]
MDLSILIFIALFMVACFSLFLIYKYGIKEKSYEEAVAEQRQQTNSLLGTKSKPKEKKNKKSNKKKEKSVQDNEINEFENTANKENTPKLRVEFKEEAEEVPITEELKLPSIKEQNKKKSKKVRPILVNKEKSPIRIALEVIETPIVNHFEENPPKDDFELLRSNSKDDIFKPDPVSEKVTKEKKSNVETNVAVKNKKNAKLQPIDNNKIEKTTISEEKKAEEKIIVAAIPLVPQTNGIVVGNPGKEKKKKKSEFNTKQQLTAERDELINSVRKAELSKTEIQLLIDLLLNKQLEAPAIIDDWSEGKSDPIQKLKKQLAEKEKALAEEHQALTGAQAKLREIRAEQQLEKSQLQQKIRAMEEAVQTKQIEIQAANNRYQVNIQKIQQLQAELNAEIMKTHKLVEDNGALQLQIQQYEVSLSKVQETENLIHKMKSDLEEVSNTNQQLQQLVVEKDHQNQHLAKQLTNMEKGYKDSILDLKKQLEMCRLQESDWNRERSGLNTNLQKQYEEKRQLEHTIAQLNDQMCLYNNEKTESVKLIAQLKSELQQTREDLTGLRELSDSKTKHEVEIRNLSNELSSTRNELSSRIEELQQTEKKYRTELETSNKKYIIAQKELEEQKAKNNELRTKNWKVIEALNAAESKNKSTNNKHTEIDIKKLSADIINKEQESRKQFMERLFPDIEEIKNIDAKNLEHSCEKLIREYIKALKENQKDKSSEKSADVAKLQSQIQHYKKTIDDTESILSKLQKHVEQEEKNWRNQLAAKEAELDNLKETCVSQLKASVSNLEKQLSKEVDEKQKLLEETRILKSERLQTKEQTNSTVIIEKLSEEVNRLREQLRVEQTKNGDVAVCLKSQNGNSSANGPAFLEHCLSSSSSVASSLIEDYKKPKNKKRKKKVPNVRNSNICSNMGCQFLYCDGNSCGNNI